MWPYFQPQRTDDNDNDNDNDGDEHTRKNRDRKMGQKLIAFFSDGTQNARLSVSKVSRDS
jgi:hypothetical protein